MDATTELKSKDQIRNEWAAALEALTEAAEVWGRFIESQPKPSPADFLEKGSGLVQRVNLLNAGSRYARAIVAKREARA